MVLRSLSLSPILTGRRGGARYALPLERLIDQQRPDILEHRFHQIVAVMSVSGFWLIVFGAAFVVQGAYWLLLQVGFRRAHRPAARLPEAPPPISIIVPVRNEAANLPALLAALTRQTYPHYEIVLVDDASTDATATLARTWQQAHSNLRLLTVEEPKEPRKKHALTQGIEAATHDLLAFTDADCTPTPDWLATLAQHHVETPQETLLVGYSPFRKAPGLLNRLARYETFVTGFLTAATVGLGRPYMAVGRSISYSRAVFRRIGGFAHSLHSLSGDDDLLVQEVARRRAAVVRHVFDPRSFVPSNPPATWQGWFRQKRRHLSAGRFYDRGTQTHLGLFHATSIVLWAAPLAMGWVGLGLLGAKLLIQAAVLYRAAAALHERDLLPTQPFLELLYAAYNLVLAPLGLARMPKRW